MKRTMTKEEFDKIIEYGDLDDYEKLSEAGISFDIYYDSDGQIIKPGDECEFWEGCRGVFWAFANDLYIGRDDASFIQYKICRKLPTEVWEPVPENDIYHNEDGTWYINTYAKWAKTRVNNGKLEGVRVKKDEEGVRK